MLEINAIGKYSCSTLPIFPDFEALTINHKVVINTFTSFLPNYSDFNFFSMFTYNVNDGVKISSINGNLVVKFYDYLTSKPFYTFLGTNKVEETVLTLTTLSLQDGLEPTLKLIPEINVDSKLKTLRKTYEVTEDPDNFDYICSTEGLGALSGGTYRSQKNMVNKLLKTTPRISTHFIESIAQHQDSIMELFNRWLLWKNRDHFEDHETERQAILKAIKYSETFDLLNLLVYEDSKLIGFFITDIDNGRATTSFTKADPAYPGLSTYLFHITARELFKKGFNEMNLEQDLGIPGLRQAKRSWNPVGYLKKYIIRTKS